MKSFKLTYISDFLSYVQDIPEGSAALIKLNISPLHQRLCIHKGKRIELFQCLMIYRSFIKKNATPFQYVNLISLHCISHLIFYSQ